MFDARFFSFGKFALPKTASVAKIDSEIVIGYFDNVLVKKINPNEKYYNIIDQYLMAFFDMQHSKINQDTQDISRQNLFAFTNCESTEKFTDNNYAFSSEKLDRFWNNNIHTFNRFYSLLHIKDCEQTDLNKLLRWLNNIFNSNSSDEYTAVFYFTFDYSDIIICAKNISVSDYAKKIFSINYDYQNSSTEAYSFLIRDSFSILAFNNEIICKIFNCIDANRSLSYEELSKNIINLFTEFKEIICEDTINAVYNIGIQNYDLYENFTKDLENCKIPYETFHMLGRHDITISKSDANILWLIILLYYVDMYSKTEDINQINKLLFNCESFIRIKPFDIKNDIINPNSTEDMRRYKLVKDVLETKVKLLITICAKKLLINSVQESSLISICDSIINIFKNGFADDFVICIYESYVSFLNYLIKKAELDDDDNIEKFNDVYNSYFEIVSSLVNSAMHSDRQFIQTPSFNPVFYDVPPKLMAFYTVLTNDITKLNNWYEASTYSFIFKPSFLNNIAVYPYSYSQSPPTDRLLAVSINEESLYQPTNVIDVMCHEVAHYVGDEQRSRETRKKYWVKAILFVVYKMILNALDFNEINSCCNLNNLLLDLVNDDYNIICSEYYYDEETGYSENFNIFLYQIFNSLCNNIKTEKILKEFFINNFEDLDCVECVKLVKYNITLLSHFIPENVTAQLKTNFSITRLFFDWYKNLLSIFRESYADIQMILLAELSFENYIRNFVLYENMKIDDFVNDSTFYRVFSVIYTLYELGIWDLSIDNTVKNDNVLENIIEFFKFSISWQNNNCPIDIEKTLESCVPHLELNVFDENSSSQAREKFDSILVKKESYIVNMIYCYLSDVFDKTKNHYSTTKKDAERHEFRKKISQLINESDAVKLFYNIQNINKNHLNNLIQEQTSKLSN